MKLPSRIWCCGCEEDAEIIIRLCADLCDKYGDKCGGGAAYGCRDYILQMFGLPQATSETRSAK